MRHEKRSAWRVEQQQGLWPELDHAARPPEVPHAGAACRGVGGRQAGRAARVGGGGYLDGRTPAEVRADPRLRELAEIGLQAHWLAVADVVGYDRFIGVWRLLSADPSLRNDDDQIELRLRPFRSFERYQRNRYIDTLVSAGLRASEIHDLVRKDLGEKLTLRHIKRLAAASRARVMGEDADESQPTEPAAAPTVRA